MRFSCVIPARDKNDLKLKDLISSIKAQDFPQDQIEIHVITEGDSESAKAIGIKRSTGDICVMLCADNYLTDPTLFSKVNKEIGMFSSVYEKHYFYDPCDNSLNRYFSLIGNNDPVPFYLGKCDREPWVDGLYKTTSFPSYGCNGFFVRREAFKDTNLDDYYPMDAHLDMSKKGHDYLCLDQGTVWHRTSDSLISFLKKRYNYAKDLYCDRSNRRWRIIDTIQDKLKLLLFIFSVITIFPCIYISLKGFIKIKDLAWFYHWPVCVGFLIIYSFLVFRNLIKHKTIFQRN